MNKQQKQAKVRTLGQMVRDGKPVPQGTILGDEYERMVVTGSAWYDMELNRSETYKLGWTFMYEGDLVRYSRSLNKAVRRTNNRGETISLRIPPAKVRAVLVMPVAEDAVSPT